MGAKRKQLRDKCKAGIMKADQKKLETIDRILHGEAGDDAGGKFSQELLNM